jgi:hypothetical protein
MCTTCHGVGTFAGNRMSASEWESEVANMVARGAQGSPAEVRTAVDYLVKNLGAPSK